MQKNPLLSLVTRQTGITLYNIQVVLSTCRLDEEFAEQPIWRLLYKALRQLDCGLIESDELRRTPAFHQTGLDNLSSPYSGKPLSKEQLVDYYLDLKARLFLYLDELDDTALLKPYKRGTETRLDTIFTHLRRFTYEIGRINAFTELRSGKRPLFFDTDRNYPTDHQYFEDR